MKNHPTGISLSGISLSAGKLLAGFLLGIWFAGWVVGRGSTKLSPGTDVDTTGPQRLDADGTQTTGPRSPETKSAGTSTHARDESSAGPEGQTRMATVFLVIWTLFIVAGVVVLLGHLTIPTIHHLSNRHRPKPAVSTTELLAMMSLGVLAVGSGLGFGQVLNQQKRIFRDEELVVLSIAYLGLSAIFATADSLRGVGRLPISICGGVVLVVFALVMWWSRSARPQPWQPSGDAAARSAG